MNSQILVIGGAGYIGSHVAKILKKQRYAPVILDDLSTGHRQAVPTDTPFYEGHAGNPELVKQVIKKHQIQSVMHFSAKATVAESVANPLLYYESNVGETTRLLSTLIECGIKYFVFSSTCSTFGEPQKSLLDESHPQNPINPYGRSKLMVEEILKDLDGAYDFHAAILRYFNAAGADPDGVLGEDHRPETHLIPRVLATILGRQEQLVINGNDYPTPDGTCIRDYIHVNDLAEGHINALKYIQEHQTSCDFNLGSARGYSNFEIIQTVERVTGCKVNYALGPRRPGDPPVLVANTEKAQKLIRWSPRYTLDEMIDTAYRWMQSHPQGYK